MGSAHTHAHVVIWDEDAPNFGRTRWDLHRQGRVGELYSYEGRVQVEAWTPFRIEVMDWRSGGPRNRAVEKALPSFTCWGVAIARP